MAPISVEIERPSMRAPPDVGGRRPVNIEIVVVLPAPGKVMEGHGRSWKATEGGDMGMRSREIIVVLPAPLAPSRALIYSGQSVAMKSNETQSEAIRSNCRRRWCRAGR